MTNLIKSAAAAAALAFLSACTSDVLQLSENTYMISKTSGAGAFASKSGMQAKAIKAANAFAAKQGKVAIATGSEWERPAQGFPTFTYHFMLVDKNDPRAKDRTLEKVPDVVIETK